MTSPKYDDTLEKHVAEAYKRALKIVQKESPPDTHANSHVVAAAALVPFLIEINCDSKDE